MFYPMLADVYYSVQTQHPSGAMEDEWVFSQTVPCELKTGSFNTEMRFAQQTYDEFFFLPTVLYGRFDRDITKIPNGSSVPISELAVTNVRTRDCADDGDVLFTEADDGVQKPIIYEVRSLSPFVNPWGKAEHWKTQLVRADDQDGVL